MPKSYAPPQSEWSYLISAEDIDNSPKLFSFAANAQERTDLARRFGIVSIENVDANVTMQRAPGGIIHAMGTLRADVTQSCTITLVPVPNHIEEEFEGWFGDKEKTVSFAKAIHEREAQKNHAEAEILEESEDPEPIIGGKIDIGELAAQYLSLALDPYPRADGVTGDVLIEPPSEVGEEPSPVRKNPFEALKDWKEKR